MNEVKILTEQDQIEKANRILIRARFSVFYRKLNNDLTDSEIQAIDKICRFLGSENNQNYVEKSNFWKGMLEHVNKTKTDYTNSIETSKEKAEKELKFLEEIESNVYGENEFDFDYFNTIFKYADVNGDSDDFDDSLKYMLKAYGFLDKEKKEEKENV